MRVSEIWTDRIVVSFSDIFLSKILTLRQCSGNGHPVGQRFSYIRVSSADQNLARQREMIGTVDKEFLDKLSARSRTGRSGLERCAGYLRDRDELIVASIDRLARSLVDLRSIINQITAKGAVVHFVKENLTFSAESTDPRATFVLGILGSFAEFKRAIIRERRPRASPWRRKPTSTRGVNAP